MNLSLNPPGMAAREELSRELVTAEGEPLAVQREAEHRKDDLGHSFLINSCSSALCHAIQFVTVARFFRVMGQALCLAADDLPQGENSKRLSALPLVMRKAGAESAGHEMKQDTRTRFESEFVPDLRQSRKQDRHARNSSGLLGAV